MFNCHASKLVKGYKRIYIVLMQAQVEAEAEKELGKMIKGKNHYMLVLRAICELVTLPIMSILSNNISECIKNLAYSRMRGVYMIGCNQLPFWWGFLPTW